MIRLLILFYTILFALEPSICQVVSYHPNIHWQVPGRLRVSAQRPAFNMFFPQYGYSKRLLNGHWQNQEWTDWMKQNNFSTPNVLQGHAWQAVIERNKEIFRRHPEYLAEVNGVRLGYERTSKLCVSNRQVQALFIADRIKAFSEDQRPDGTVGVEPSDGDGFCECKDCKKLGTISNQVFYLANRTARALAAIYPNGKVNLLAYYLHAAIPDFDLEPNVHVTVVPEGFQTDYDPDLMLVLWAKKAKLKTYYEYFSIPQWKGDLPRIHIHNYLRRMNLARRLGYQGYWFETGLNLPTVITLQLFNQLWLDPRLNWENVSETFLQSCFRTSYTPMKRMFTRWWHTWMPEEEAAQALFDLAEASALVKNKEEAKRILDLKAYVHYIILYQRWEKDVKNQKAAKEVFDYVYNSSTRLLLHPIAFYAMYQSYLPPAEEARYNLFARDDWRWLKPLNKDDIERHFREDLKREGSKKGVFLPATLANTLSPAQRTKLPLQSFSLDVLLSTNISFYGKGRLTAQFSRFADMDPPRNDSGFYVSVLNEAGKLIDRRFVPARMLTYTVLLPAEGLYSIALNQFYQVNINLKGQIVPLLTEEQNKMYEKQKKDKGKALKKPASLPSTYYPVWPD
jgi:hypothetical protein